MDEIMTFEDLGLNETTLDALNKKGFTQPTPIQKLVIPPLLEAERDVVGQAQTGTGKTAAFSLPLLEDIDPKSRKVQAVVLTPTRELAVQVCKEMQSLCGSRRISILPVYGGQSIEMQLNKLRRGVQVVVGTPGRVIDHLKRGTLKLDSISRFILDEADEMLNMGFLEDVEKILGYVNEDRSMLLFSATMPRPVLRIAEQYMGDYVHLKAKATQETNENVNQRYVLLRPHDKLNALVRILDTTGHDFHGLIFCKTRQETDDVAGALSSRGFSVEALHGDIPQGRREMFLGKFRKRVLRILVATDVAARGIDVADLTHVINHSLPHNHDTYVHRVGRTGRAGKEGLAVSLVTPSEQGLMRRISKAARVDIKKMSLPAIDDVIAFKRERISTKLNDIISRGGFEEFGEFADAILAEHEPKTAVCAMIKQFLGSELSKSSYTELQEPAPRNPRDSRGGYGGRGGYGDRGGYDRGGRGGAAGSKELKYMRGRKAGMTPRDLLAALEKDAGTFGRKVQGIRVMDHFTLFHVPEGEADIILERYRRNARGKRPMVIAGGGGKGGGYFKKGGAGAASNRDRRPKRTFTK
ncbi:MAG: DEAD/DEAH box helicase [Desulfovibrio sp.]